MARPGLGPAGLSHSQVSPLRPGLSKNAPDDDVDLALDLSPDCRYFEYSLRLCHCRPGPIWHRNAVFGGFGSSSGLGENPKVSRGIVFIDSFLFISVFSFIYVSLIKVNIDIILISFIQIFILRSCSNSFIQIFILYSYIHIYSKIGGGSAVPHLWPNPPVSLSRGHL